MRPRLRLLGGRRAVTVADRQIVVCLNEFFTEEPRVARETHRGVFVPAGGRRCPGGLHQHPEEGGARAQSCCAKRCRAAAMNLMMLASSVQGMLKENCIQDSPPLRSAPRESAEIRACQPNDPGS